jgi:histidine ammonia-lyase
MMAQVTAAALVSECKTLSHPASVDSIPTSADKEDHVSMATWAARKAGQVVERARTVLAIETLAAGQALDFLQPLAPGAGVAAMHAALRQRVPFLEGDRTLSPLIDDVAALIRDGSLRAAAADVVGPLP